MTHECIDGVKRKWSVYFDAARGKWHIDQGDIDEPVFFCPFCGHQLDMPPKARA